MGREQVTLPVISSVVKHPSRKENGNMLKQQIKNCLDHNGKVTRLYTTTKDDEIKWD